MSTHPQTVAPPPVRLGVLLSGRGSNFQAIAAAITAGQILQATVAAVVSNNPQAPGLAFASAQHYPTAVFLPADFDSRAAFDAAMATYLTAQQVDWVVLAGYDRILSPGFIEAFEDRIVNIHPSLLPRFGGRGMVGKRVHEAVLASGEATSGCTVHGVTTGVDEGPILGQQTVAVLPADTPDTLAARVLAAEHHLYPQIIGQLVAHTVQATIQGSSPEQTCRSRATVLTYLADQSNKQQGTVPCVSPVLP